MWGFYDARRPGVIHLRAAAASPREAAWLASHEAFHVHQHRAGAPMGTTRGEAREQIETEANRFADQMIMQYDDGGLDD